MLGRMAKQVGSSLTVDGYLEGSGCLAVGTACNEPSLRMKETI